MQKANCTHMLYATMTLIHLQSFLHILSYLRVASRDRPLVTAARNLHIIHTSKLHHLQTVVVTHCTYYKKCSLFDAVCHILVY